MKSFFHILNPSRVHRAQVKKYFERNEGLDHMWVERQMHPTHLETIVQWAVNEGKKQIAVWGGDGTLNRVVNELYSLNAFEKVAVALVPSGTCNDFARYLKLPPWKKYVKGFGKSVGLEERIDLGLMKSGGSEKVFLNNAGFGRSPAALGQRSNPINDIVSFTEKKLDLEWKINGARSYETRTALLGIIFNAPYFNGGMYFDSSLRVDDGVLVGFFEDPQSKKSLIWKFLKSRLGYSLRSHHSFKVEFDALRFESNMPLYPQIDGERAFDGPVKFLDFSVLPKTFRLILWR